MARNSRIEWCDDTWNPTVGCSIVSPGCTNCYAMKMAARLEAMGQPIYQGHTQPTKAGPVWTGKVGLSNWGQVIKPLRWKRPRRIFVNSMSDLFHETLPDEAIDKVFAVMALCPQHTFQVLTKRPERMREYCARLKERAVEIAQRAVWLGIWDDPDIAASDTVTAIDAGPLPNVWLGVSCEDQARADERIPLLLKTPAAIRFISAEPLLGPIDLTRIRDQYGIGTCLEPTEIHGGTGQAVGLLPALDWVIVGSESGPGARPGNITWLRSIRDQCLEAEVPVFIKQLGCRPYWDLCNGFGPWPKHVSFTRTTFDGRQIDAITLRDKKGGDMSEWPEDLRVREFPT